MTDPLSVESRQRGGALLASVFLGSSVLQVAVPVELGHAVTGHLAQMPPPVLEVGVAFL